MAEIAHALIHVFIALTLPPLLPGAINKTKAFFGGRAGPPVLQLYYDLFKLFRKGAVISTTSTWVFLAGPVIGLAAVAVAALLVPLADHTPPLSFPGDLILLAYVLALARFFTAAAALDTGSAFEGMGAAREVTFACLAEPALFFGLLVLARLARSLRLADMLAGGIVAHWDTYGASLALVAVSWFLLLLVENCRVPFDDPNTHLELTMIHEVMVLDHGGPALALMLYGAALKLFVFAALLVRIVWPFSTGNAWLDWGLLLPGLLLVAVAVGVVESVMARLRLLHVPQLLVTACLLSAFGIILLVR